MRILPPVFRRCSLGIFRLKSRARSCAALTTSVAFIDRRAIINKGTTNRARKSWSDWSPRLVVDYHFSDTGMRCHRILP